MRFAIKCPRCGSTIRLEPPWMRLIYSCRCKPDKAMLAFSVRLAATQSPTSTHDELNPETIARMYYYIRELRVKHAGTCNLCKAVAEQGLVCPDLEELRIVCNKWLSLKITCPEEKHI